MISRKSALTLVRIAISAVLLTWIISRQNTDTLIQAWKSMPALYWLATIFIIWSGLLVGSMKLNYIIGIFRVRIPLRKTFVIYLVSSFFGNLLPGTVGADLVKFGMFNKYKITRTQSVISIFFERFFGVLTLLLSALFGMRIAREFYTPALIIYLAILCLAVFMTILFLMLVPTNRLKTGVRISTAIEVAAKIIRCKKVFSVSSLLSFIFVLHGVAVFWVILQGLGQSASLSDIFFIVVLVQTITILPISLNGLGLREVSYAFFLPKIGIPSEIGVSAGIIIYVSIILSSIPGGLLYLGKLDARPHENLDNNKAVTRKN